MSNQAPDAARVKGREPGTGSLLDAVLVEDADGVVTAVSTALDELVGVPVASIAGGSVDDIVHRDDRERLDRTRSRALASGSVAECTVRIAAATERSAWRVAFHPDLPVAGGGMVVLLQDVQRLQTVAREAALLRRVTELANVATDARDVLDRAVPDVRRTMGWAAGHAVRVTEQGLVSSQVWDLDDPSRVLPRELVGTPPTADGGVVGRAVTHAEPASDVDVTDDDPRMAAARAAGLVGSVALPIVADGRVHAVLEFVTETPVHLDDRRLLLEVGRQLGAVVARAAVHDELAHHRDELQRSNAELERFAYVASHDLQEPLRKIIGFAELLIEHRPPQDEDEEAFLGYITDGAFRMQRLIKDLLAYSRAGRRELAHDRVDLDAVIDDVIADLGVGIEETDATVEVERPLPAAVGDAGQLRVVLQNLVENALKYRSELPPLIRIAASTTDAELELVVTDNGIGIEPEFRASVFEVFRRLHPSHQYPGTGLGLALVERVVERHGGRVRIEDGPGGTGTAIHVTLPRHEG